MKNKSRYKTIVLLICVIGAVFSLISVFGLIEHQVNKTENLLLSAETTAAAQKTVGQIFYNGNWYRPKESVQTLLVLGIDKLLTGTENQKTSEQVDFLALLVMEEEQHSYRILYLNRDTMTDILQTDIAGVEYGTFRGQLALAHAYGSNDGARCRNTVRAVETLLYDIEIDHYMSLTMDAVALLNDSVGGVTLQLLDDFTALDDSYTRDAVVTLTGQQALSYVRARSELENSSNLSRMERQRQYIRALIEAFADSETYDEEHSFETLLQINDYMVSDCTIEQLSALAEKLKGYTCADTLTLSGQAVQGQEYMEFHIDEAAVQKTVLELFFEPVG